MGTPTVAPVIVIPPAPPLPEFPEAARPNMPKAPVIIAPSVPSDAALQEKTLREEEELRLRLEEKFHSQLIRDAALQKLRDTIASATDRMRVLSGQPLNQDAKSAVAQTLAHLDTLNTEIAVSDLSARDIEARAGELRMHLQETQEVVAKAAPVQSTSQADGIIAKLDGIFGALPNVFTFLQQEQVGSSPTTSTEYLTALTLYTNTRAKCLANADHCTAIGTVLSHLEVMRASLLQSLELSGKKELEGQIDEMLRQR